MDIRMLLTENRFYFGWTIVAILKVGNDTSNGEIVQFVRSRQGYRSA